MLSDVRPTDAAALAAVHAGAFDRPWSAREIAALLDGPGVFGVAADSGFALARVAADEAELLTIAVAPERRRSGLGRALLEAVVVRAAAAGAAALHLEVGEDNPAALALYEAAGFARVGRRRGYYERANGRADAIVMSLSLPSPPV